MRYARAIVVATVTLLALQAAAEQTPLQIAGQLLQEAKWTEAAAVLEELVIDNPKDAAAWMQLGRAYDGLGDFDKELDAAQKAIDAGFPAPGIAKIAMVKAYAGKGDKDAALAKLEEIAAAGSNGTVVRRLETTAGLDGLKEDPRWTKAIKALTPCTAPEYRQFDFWLGDFAVENPNGVYVGDNEITLHLGGCMLMESWKGAAGMHGMSMNYYDPTDETWNQIFIDNNGNPSNWPPLKGKFENGSMVLWSPAGDTRSRWTWTKVDDDKVRQMAESTSDGGKTWQVTWDSYYIRKK